MQVPSSERVSDGAAARRVLLVSVAPIPRSSLERGLGELAAVRAVDFGTPAYGAAIREPPPHVTIVDLTHLRNLRKAQVVAGQAAPFHLVFLGYADDGGAEVSLAYELGARFNPTLPELVEVVRSIVPEPAPGIAEGPDAATAAARHLRLVSRQD